MESACGIHQALRRNHQEIVRVLDYCRIPDSRTKLERLGDDLTKTLEKIFKSEKVINSNMSDVGAQYRTKSEDYKKLSTHYNNLNVSIK